MIPWNLGEKEFYDWMLQKLAKEALVEQKEEFAEQFPPEELKHIYGILDEKAMPILTQNGIPISREEIHRMFRSWFVKRASPNVQRSDESPTDARAPLGCLHWVPSGAVLRHSLR